MAPLRGRLISASFVRDELLSLPGVTQPPVVFLRALERWWEATDAAIGPASSIRAIAESATIPLLRLLEYEVTGKRQLEQVCVLETATSGRRGPDVMVVGWEASLDHVWRASVLQSIARDTRWSLCTNGMALRFVDGRRTWSREYLELDLAAIHDEAVTTLLWALARGPAMIANPRLLDRAVEASAEHGTAVCRALGRGVLEAVETLMASLRRARSAGRAQPRRMFEHSLNVLYRVLFLLFAEARGLVPVAHPLYQDRYSLEALVGTLVTGASSRGLWQAIQAICRLAHSGCVAGDLRINAFNGQLFAPPDRQWERWAVPDAAMASALLSVATTSPGPASRTRRTPMSAPSAGGRRPILYRDLDVEQLGSVYEQALEYEPAASPSPGALRRTRDVRKASGTFYTPRQVTDHVVRTTLGPLVEHRTAAEILALRVLDPAMGSGAFLVAACRFLAHRVEHALVQEGRWHRGDVTDGDRTALRREIALRCLYGVDLNPMAVQLARLSLWLATLAADKPLSFLDHHLVAGNSLIGATPADVLWRPTKVSGRRERTQSLPLFGHEALEPALEQAVRVRTHLAIQPDESATIVRQKERDLASLMSAGGPIRRWHDLLDLWCAGWFWPSGSPPAPEVFGELAQAILRDDSALPRAMTTALMDEGRRIAAAHRFLHWPIVFPEAFQDETGRPLANPGFDAILGNPPWDMVRGDSGAEDVRASRREHARQLADFTRESGIYVVETRAHVNRYQLFVERALHLVRRGGRIGMVLPSGLVSDTGAAALRRHLMDRAEVDSVTGLDNRGGIFPIHRSMRFAVVTATAGAPTHAITCRFGLTHPEQLENRTSAPLVLSRALLARLSGADDLGIPEFPSEVDLRICEGIAARIPRLESDEGWHAQFGRELNASDDRDKLRPATGRRNAKPVVEGKQIAPFRIHLDGCRFEVQPGAHLPAHIGGRQRLAYRDVASATNRLTLIAAILPPHAVSTHTLFCLRTRLDASEQHVLCALLNSFVANYLIRLRVNTHVTTSLVARLPVPVVRPGDPRFGHLVRLAQSLARGAGDVEASAEYATLQAVAATLYGLTMDELTHVLSTFPLIDREVRRRTSEAFQRDTRPD